MKLFLNAESKSLNSIIDPSFSRCNYFLIYQTEDDGYEFIENEFQDLQTSVGAAVANKAIELGVEAVIAVNPGPRAFNALNEAGIKIYHAKGDIKIKQVLKSFANDELLTLESYLPSQG